MATAAAALNALVARNRSGQYKAGPGGRGFLCADAPGGVVRRLRGITKAVARYFPRPRSASSPRIKLFSLPAGVCAVRSNAAMGERIHRQVMHTLFCGCTTVCRCVGTGLTPALHTQSPTVQACVAAAQQFMVDYALRPFAAELVIAHRTLPLATRLDALFVSRANSAAAAAEPVLVSWKTGCGPRTELEHRRHMAQLAFEQAVLTGSHGVPVARAYVVYLSGGIKRGSRSVQGFYDVEQLEPATAIALYTTIKTKAAAAAARKKRKKRTS